MISFRKSGGISVRSEGHIIMSSARTVESRREDEYLTTFIGFGSTYIAPTIRGRTADQDTSHPGPGTIAPVLARIMRERDV